MYLPIETWGGFPASLEFTNTPFLGYVIPQRGVEQMVVN